MPTVHPDSERIRTEKHCELEAEWQQLMQKHGQVAISGLMLQEKAVQFWTKMPIYAEQMIPKFSQG